MSYNEYWQVIDAGFKPDQLVVFRYEDQGVATLEDGLYALESKLKDKAFVARLAKFVAASEKVGPMRPSTRTRRPGSCWRTMPAAPRPRSTRSA